MLNEQLLPIIMVGVVIVIAASVVIWRLSARITQSGVRTLLRIGAIVGTVALVGFGGMSVAGTQMAAQAQAETLVPAELMTVSTGDLAVTLSAAGSLLPADEKVLAFETSAPVLDVLVSTGDFVSAGDVLARLDTTDLEAQIRTAEIALAEAQAAYDELVAEPTEIEIAQAEASVEAAQASLSSASLMGPSAADIEIARLETELAKNQLWQSQINRDVRLAPNPEFRGDNAYAQELSTNAGVEQQELSVQQAQSEFEDTLTEGPDGSSLTSANAQLESAEASLETLLNGPSEADLRRATIDLETAQMDLDNARRQLESAVLIAPFDGLVAAENVTAGSLPPTDEDAFTLIDLSQYTVSLSIDETDIVELALGQQVELDVQAFDDTVVTGQITRIDLSPTVSGELVTYTTEVTLDPAEVALRPGMSAVASVVLEQVDDVITVPNRFIQTDAATQRTVVTVQTAPGTYQTVPVTLGLRTLEQSQIIDGLSVGQTIVILDDGEADADTPGGLGIPGIPGTGGGPGGGGGRPAGGF